ncbi:MAG TPA: FISUMP domain-containing protein [Flavobacteriales bacterium]|nr:FISUMP domain-containing protein [Flavobacteriales bacterium]
MKKRILFLGFILMILSLQLSAQTLKNIHCHNQPVLHIPTHLIDKVETADVNGERVLKIIQFNGYVSQIPVSQIDSITHSAGQAVDPAQLGNLRTASIMGVVRDTGNAPVNMAIVRSAFSGEVTHTDANGVFFLNNITVYDKLGYITIEKPGYHKGSRSFLPLDEGSNRVNIELLPMALSGSFNSTSGGQITSGLLQLTFPANAIQLNGQPYTGTVNVYAQALDPTSPEMFDQMPGELLGGMNDSLRLLRSFGMASIELRDTSMNELQMANGVSASLTFNIPTALQAEAPETIDWWSFDESLGYWKHEGEAIKQDSQYVGQANHFTWWNYDVPQNFNDFNGTINSVSGTPVSDAQVNVVTQTLGTGVTYTNSEGVFTGRVPKNQQLTLNVYLTCSTTNDWNLAHSETIASETQPLSIVLTANLENRYPITGTVVNCEGQPVDLGYVKMNGRIFILDNGTFSIQTCQMGTYSIRSYDISNSDSVNVSNLIDVQVGISGVDAGMIATCSTMFGSVSDIDGNLYSTVLIGDQWWMAENLKTIHFADGTLIPNITESLTWSQLSSPAWCNYNNSILYGSIYGKLYNWFTVADPRNVCPDGWHVPSDTEWTLLTDYLGGFSTAGGKMKAITGWNAPNTGANNESLFTGLPGGYIQVIGNFSTFLHIVYSGMWWSNSEFSLSEAWYRNLVFNYDVAAYNNTNKKNGFSVRCIKD